MPLACFFYGSPRGIAGRTWFNQRMLRKEGRRGPAGAPNG